MSEPTRWLWVFGDIAALRWVVAKKRMAFTEVGARRAEGTDPGDFAILYVTRGAFHNPTRDEARLAGVAEVTGPLRRQRTEVAGRAFTHQIPIDVVTLLSEREGPSVKALAPQLERVRKLSAWGQYFRNSPVRLTAADFDLMRAAIDAHEAPAP